MLKITLARQIHFLVLFCFACVTAHSQVLPGTPEAEADWRARATSPSVLYATNFDDVYLDGVLDVARSGISNTTELAAESHESPGADQYEWDSTIKLSGSGSIKMWNLAEDGGGTQASWSYRPDGRTGAVRNRFYAQVSIRVDRNTLAWRANDSGSPKYWKFGQFFENGEFVLTNSGYTGFLGGLLNGTSGASRVITDAGLNGPFTGQPIKYIQNAICPTGDLNGFATISDALQACGVIFDRGSGGQPFGGSDDGEGDYRYYSGDEWLDLRSSIAPYAFPNTNSNILGQSLLIDDWITVEVFLDADNDKAMVWMAKYGEAPRLVIDTDYSSNTLNATPASHYNYIQLLVQSTNLKSEGSRPQQNRWYDEVIVSTDPIDFPGGFDLDSKEAPPPPDGSNDVSKIPAPNWVSSIEPGTWATISLNTLSDVDPRNDPAANPNFPGAAPWSGNTGQGAVLGAWNGAAFADGVGEYGSLIAYGGGHADYYGSEVYSFDLESRLWTRLTNPYAGPFNWPYNTAEYPDGSAIPPHTYDYVNYHPASNSFVIMKGQNELGPPSNATSMDIPHLFDFDTLTWHRGPENSADPNLFSGGYSAYDSKRDLFWAHGGDGANNFVSFDPNGTNSDGTVGSWNTYPFQSSRSDSQAEYDPVNDILVITAFRGDDAVIAIDLDRPSDRRVFLNDIGDLPTKNAAHGWSWSARRKSILYFSRVSGADVHEFRHASGSWNDGQWIWGKITAPTNEIVPDDVPSTGIYSKFQVVSYLDAEIVLLVNKTTGPVYAFRVPDPIRPKPPDPLD